MINADSRDAYGLSYSASTDPYGLRNTVSRDALDSPDIVHINVTEELCRFFESQHDVMDHFEFLQNVPEATSGENILFNLCMCLEALKKCDKAIGSALRMHIDFN